MRALFTAFLKPPMRTTGHALSDEQVWSYLTAILRDGEFIQQQTTWNRESGLTGAARLVRYQEPQTGATRYAVSESHGAAYAVYDTESRPSAEKHFALTAHRDAVAAIHRGERVDLTDVYELPATHAAPRRTPRQRTAAAKSIRSAPPQAKAD